MKVISFYDVTGNAVRPWAEQGYECICYDLQNNGSLERFPNGGSIRYRNADLHNEATWRELEREFNNDIVALVLGFPVCTDLAVSGAKHWAGKRAKNPNFQTEAVDHAKRIADFAKSIDAPFAIENPVGALSTLWRRPDFYFHPCDFGGYIHWRDSEHPDYPEYIAPRDAYTKKTGIWCGNGFDVPECKPVPAVPRDRFGMSKQFAKLGGKSAKTKNIRSATPRGFAIAVFQANGFPLYRRTLACMHQ